MDKDILKTLVPISSLTPENFRELASQAVIERLPAGSQLFMQGDHDSLSIYLLSGEVDLSSANTNLSLHVAAGTDEARYALAQLKPRQYTGTATTPVTVARVDGHLLDRLLTWDQTTGYEVTEFDGSQDTGWMMRMLRGAPDSSASSPKPSPSPSCASTDTLPVLSALRETLTLPVLMM